MVVVKLILILWFNYIGMNVKDVDRIVNLESRVGWEGRCKVRYLNSWCFFILSDGKRNFFIMY